MFFAPVPVNECTETTAAIRKMQPDTSVLSDEDLTRLGGYIDAASKSSGVSQETIIIMVYGESRFVPSVMNLMQISDTWYKNKHAPVYCRLARKSQYASIRCGAYVLSECKKRFDGQSLYLCWSGFHIADKQAFLERIKKRWKILLET